MKVHFISRLKDFVCVPFVDGSGHWNGEDWVLLSHLMIRFGDGKLVTIPAGSVTNFGSLPRPVRPFLNRMGKSLRAYVVHDWLYSKLPNRLGINLSQRQCDKVLFDLSLEDNESWVSAQAINKGLLLGGWTHFKKSKPIVKPVSKSVIKYIIESNRYQTERWCDD